MGVDGVQPGVAHTLVTRSVRGFVSAVLFFRVAVAMTLQVLSTVLACAVALPLGRHGLLAVSTAIAVPPRHCCYGPPAVGTAVPCIVALPLGHCLFCPPTVSTVLHP